MCNLHLLVNFQCQFLSFLNIVLPAEFVDFQLFEKQKKEIRYSKNKII